MKMCSQRVLFQSCVSVVNCLACVFLSVFCCAGQQPHLVPGKPSAALKVFLQKELTDPIFGIDKTTRFSSAIIKYDGGAKVEIVVYFSGELWCGSGGCRMLILDTDGVSFNVIYKMTVARPPIRVLHSMSNGRYDIGVWVQGGGVQPGYEAILRYDGTFYRCDPSVSSKIAGKVIISSGDEGELLYK